MKRVSLDPSERQAQQKTPQKPTLKPNSAVEAQKPSASADKVNNNNVR